jgi:hypothetical protein
VAPGAESCHINVFTSDISISIKVTRRKKEGKGKEGKEEEKSGKRRYKTEQSTSKKKKVSTTKSMARGACD